jgi:hypothetical protein
MRHPIGRHCRSIRRCTAPVGAVLIRLKARAGRESLSWASSQAFFSLDFPAIVSTRRTSETRSSLSEIFTNASAIRNACGSNANVDNGTDLHPASVAPAKNSEIGTPKGIRDLVQPARSDAIDAFLVLQDLLECHVQEFAKRRLGHLPSHPHDADPRAHENVDGICGSASHIATCPVRLSYLFLVRLQSGFSYGTATPRGATAPRQGKWS